MTEAKVAVIMRTKNRPLLLKRALASVRCQSFTDWHLYVVNDGGDHQAVVDLLPAVDSAKCTLISNPTSLGMEAATNIGLQACATDYVCVHDDDDSWEENFLQVTCQFLDGDDKKRFAGVATDCWVVNESIEADEVRPIGRHSLDTAVKFIEFSNLIRGNLFPPITMVFRREAVLAAGAFNEDMPVLGDWDFNIRLLMQGDIGVVHEKLANYHHRAKNESNANYHNTVVHGVTLHEEIESRFRNKYARSLFAKHPEMIGGVQLLMKRIDEMEQVLCSRGLPSYVIQDIATEVVRLQRAESVWHRAAQAIRRLARRSARK